MKNLLFGLIATVLLSFNSFGQDQYVLNLNYRISTENVLSTNDTHKLVTAKEFSTKFNGNLVIEGYSENGIVKIKSINLTFSSQSSFESAKKAYNSGCPSGYRTCARGCTTLSTEIGVILCTGYCIIDCIGG